MAVKIRINLHEAQTKIHESSARFRIVGCGRRFGKTLLDIAEVLEFAAANPGCRIWWVTPFYELGEEARLDLQDAVPEHLRHTDLRRRIVHLWNGARIFYRSADRPDTLRAVGVDFLVVDEAAFIKAERWNRELRPTLADVQGPALLSSTFNGENWFYTLYTMGQDPEYPEYESFRYPTSANPFIPPAEIEEARRTTPYEDFEQEWNANPLVYVGAIFNGEHLQRAADLGSVTPEYADAERAKVHYYGGVDWGFTNPTAFLLAEEHEPSGRVRWITERNWPSMPLGPDPTGKRETRIDHLINFARVYSIRVFYCDGAGADQNNALAGALEDAGLPTAVRAVNFGAKPKGKGSGTFKDAGITTRRWYLENELEHIGPECKELLRTSKKYRVKPDTEVIEKEDDHPVDAATCFYASRRHVLAQYRDESEYNGKVKR